MVLKYNKQLFIDNVKCFIQYNWEPEITITTKDNSRIFIIAYDNFVDLSIDDKPTVKLSDICEIFTFFNFDDVVNIEGDIDFALPIENQTIIADGKLWVNATIPSKRKMRKRICYIAIILSYLILGFFPIYFNKINPDYQGHLGLILSVIVIAIWLGAMFLLSANKHHTIEPDSKIDNWLLGFVLAPFILILILPVALIYLVFYIIDAFKNRMKCKCKVLLSKGFALKKEMIEKKTYYLVKNEIAIRIKEHSIYDISTNGGNTFIPIKDSTFVSYDDRVEIEHILYQYASCDYRDRDIYEPTVKIIEILGKYFE